MSIRTELDTTLQNWANSQSPPIPIAFEGMPFTKPTKTPFLETYLMPANTKSVTVDASRSRNRGIYQINVWCLDGKGRKEIDQLVQQIIDLFPVVPKTGTVSIDETPSSSQALMEGGWVHIPITVRYRQEV